MKVLQRRRDRLAQLRRRVAGRHHVVGERQRDLAVGPDLHALRQLRVLVDLDPQLVAGHEAVVGADVRGRLHGGRVGRTRRRRRGAGEVAGSGGTALVAGGAPAVPTGRGLVPAGVCAPAAEPCSAETPSSTRGQILHHNTLLSVRRVAAIFAAWMNRARFGGTTQGLGVGAVRRTARGADLDRHRRRELVVLESARRGDRPPASSCGGRSRAGRSRAARRRSATADRFRALRGSPAGPLRGRPSPARSARAGGGVGSTTSSVRKFCDRTARFSSLLSTKSNASGVSTRKSSSRNGSPAITMLCPAPLP